MKITPRENEDILYEKELERIGVLVDNIHFSAAVEAYNSAITLFGYRARTLALRGYSLYRLGKYNDAIKDLKSAFDIKPDAANTLFVLGRCYAELGQIDEALKCFEEVSKLDPNTSDAYTEMGLILKYKGKAAKASSVLRKALCLNPRDRLAKSALDDLQNNPDSFRNSGNNI